jgi:non-heme chloroperoxidase
VGLTAISVPVLALHGEDDQIVPNENASVLSAKLLRYATLKIDPGLLHGMLTTHATCSADLLAFVES